MLNAYIEAYVTDCGIRGLSPKTIKLYEAKLVEFYKFSSFPGDKPSLKNHLDRFQNPRTKHLAFRTVKTFVRWAAAAGLFADWLGDLRLRCQPAPPEIVILPDEWERILAQCPTSIDGRRDRCLLTVLYQTGLRRGGILGMKWADVDLARRAVRVTSKGGVEQILTLPKRAAQEINRWRLACPTSDWVFPSTRRPTRAVDARHVSRRICVYAAKAKIGRRIHTHLFRHSFGTTLAKANVSPMLIQQAMGHASLQTTLLYLRRADLEHLREEIDKVFA